MGWKSTQSGYGGPAIALHWIAVVLIVAAYCTMLFEDVFPKKSPERAAMALAHYILGLSVFALVWIRLLVRVSGVNPLVDPPIAPWQRRAADWVQWGLYAFMLIMPLLGWATASARTAQVVLFGFELPRLVSPDRELAKTLKGLHETGATIGYFLIGGHAAAALFHHYFLRDNTLRMMWPRRR